MTRLRFLLAFLSVFALGTLRPAQSAAQQPLNVTGRWAFAVTTENGTGYPTVTFKQEGEKVTGTYESARMGARAFEGTIKGDTLRFAFTEIPEGMPAFTFVAVLTDKDNLKGTLEMGGMGSANFTGKREP